MTMMDVVVRIHIIKDLVGVEGRERDNLLVNGADTTTETHR